MRYKAKIYDKERLPNGETWVLWGVWDKKKEKFIDDYDHRLGTWWTYKKKEAIYLAKCINFIK